ncbi:MAG: hypothetical protein QOD41_4321 [Cryptosporangiaceae bacterium]|nr:hypothetical protein [Cryptosporangiaceae bacterium]
MRAQTVDPGRAVVSDLALPGRPMVTWRLEFATGALTADPGLDTLLGLGGTTPQHVTAALRALVEPIRLAARTAPVWQDFEVEQLVADERWMRIRARSFAPEDAPADPAGLVGIVVDDTDQLHTRQAMTDISERYRLLVDLSPDAVVVHENGVLVYSNEAGADLLGLQPGELIGAHITDFIHRDSVPKMLERIAQLSQSGQVSAAAEAILMRPDGGTVLTEATSVRTTWEGRPAFQVIMRDITARRAAEAALKYQALLVAQVSDALIATSADGTVTSWNPAAEAVYGYAAGEAIGRPVASLVGADLDPALVVRAGGITEAIHRRSDGTELNIRVSVAALGGSDGGFVLVCADETARHRAEQYFATVVASLDEGVMVRDERGRIISVNPAAERILNVRASDSIGHAGPLSELCDEDGTPLREDQQPGYITQHTGRPEHARITGVDGRHGRAWLSMNARPLSTGGEPPYPVVISFTDITERREIGERLVYEATHDHLTGLANRAVVVSRLNESLSRSAETASAVLFIDLDNFKFINDSLGHSAGDDVLRIVSRRLGNGVRSGSLVARLGGDEFIVVAEGVRSPSEALQVAERLRESLARPVSLGGRRLRINASVGIVLAGPGDGRGAEDLLRDADVAMYQAKQRGRGRCEFFDSQLRERAMRRMQLEEDLRNDSSHRQLWMAYQPIVDLPTGQPVGVEALLRWTHPVLGAISPGEFIPVAEESDLIEDLGRFALQQAAAEMSVLRAERGMDLHINVNLSARQLDDPALVANVKRVLDESGLPPSALCMEITETTLMRDAAAATRRMNALRDLGVLLAIDDFGTGYSSLAHLRRLPIDALKIDQSFVAGLSESTDAEVIVTSIAALAHALRLKVVAEGVETEDQLRILTELGCDRAQGFYLGRPVPPAELF